MGSPVWGSDPGTPAYLERQPLTNTNYKVDIDYGWTQGLPPEKCGAQIRFTGQGMAVYMLNAFPGVYYNDHGRKVPEPVARAAGFDTDRLQKIRKRDEMMAKMAGELDAELAKGTAKNILARCEDYQVVEIVTGLYNVEFEDAEDHSVTVLNVHGPLTFEMAAKAFGELTGQELLPPAEGSQPPDADVEKAAQKRAK